MVDQQDLGKNENRLHHSQQVIAHNTLLREESLHLILRAQLDVAIRTTAIPFPLNMYEHTLAAVRAVGPIEGTSPRPATGGVLDRRFLAGSPRVVHEPARSNYPSASQAQMWTKPAQIRSIPALWSSATHKMPEEEQEMPELALS